MEATEGKTTEDKLDLTTIDIEGLGTLILTAWPDIPVGVAEYLAEFDVSVSRELRERAARKFLSEAGGWRGEIARAVKAELRERIENGSL